MGTIEPKRTPFRARPSLQPPSLPILQREVCYVLPEMRNLSSKRGAFLPNLRRRGRFERPVDVRIAARNVRRRQTCLRRLESLRSKPGKRRGRRRRSRLPYFEYFGDAFLLPAVRRRRNYFFGSSELGKSPGRPPRSCSRFVDGENVPDTRRRLRRAPAPAFVILVHSGAGRRNEIGRHLPLKTTNGRADALFHPVAATVLFAAINAVYRRFHVAPSSRSGNRVKIGNLFKISELELDSTFFFSRKSRKNRAFAPSAAERVLDENARSAKILSILPRRRVDIENSRPLPPTHPESTTKRKSLRRAALPAFQTGVGAASIEKRNTGDYHAENCRS